MRAVVITQPGGPQVLRYAEIPDPVPGEREILIRVAAAGVNRADVMQRQGHYPPPKGAPGHPGLEVSGEVVATGPGVRRWQVGASVCALLSGGGYAELVTVHEGLALPIPDGTSTVDAAGLPEVACTVWSNVFQTGGLAPGDSFLVHGGAGGIGTFAIQLAAARAARVFTTARASAHGRLRELGAELTVDYRTGDFAAEVAALGGADVILDNIGAANLPANLKALAVGGRLVVIGLQGGRKGELDLGALLAKRASVHAAGLRARPLAERLAVVEAAEREVWPHLADRTVETIVHEYVPMAEAARAHELMARGGHVGKILLVP